METLLYVAGAIIAAGAAGGVLWKLVRGVVRLLRQVREFFEDFYGEPDRPGVPGRPGVMVQLAQIRNELRPNGGMSLRDAVDRLEKNLGDHIDDESAHGPRQED